MKVIIGTDIGTSGVKVLAVDENCRVVGSNVTEYPIYTPNPGWTEQNPDDWWNAAAAGLKKLIPQLSGYEIAGVGLSGQMHGMVALDAENRVVRPAILWNDQRTEKQCKEIISAAGGLDSLISMTNNGMLTGFTAGKILWMKENEPENYKKTVRIVNPKDYIAYKLTGNVGTDVSDASGTGLFDVVNGRFSDRLITLCGCHRQGNGSRIGAYRYTGGNPCLRGRRRRGPLNRRNGRGRRQKRGGDARNLRRRLGSRPGVHGKHRCRGSVLPCLHKGNVSGHGSHPLRGRLV